MAKKKSRAKTKGSVWMRGDMIGVHPKQVKRAQARLKALEAPGTFDPKTGDLMFGSRKEYRDWAKATGRINLDAGYGDWAGATNPAEAAQEVRDRIEWARKRSG